MSVCLSIRAQYDCLKSVSATCLIHSERYVLLHNLQFRFRFLLTGNSGRFFQMNSAVIDTGQSLLMKFCPLWSSYNLLLLLWHRRYPVQHTVSHGASALPCPPHCQSRCFSVTLSTTRSVTKLQRYPVHHTVHHGASAFPRPSHCQSWSFSATLSTTPSVTKLQGYPVHHTVSNQASELPCLPHCQ